MEEMKIHNFTEDDLRMLASLAIDLETDHLFFKIYKVIQPKENYWSFDCRFSVSEDEIETWYDSFHFDCGRDNEPDTYQMSINTKKSEYFNIKPIISPLLVVHFFDEMCKRAAIGMN